MTSLRGRYRVGGRNVQSNPDTHSVGAEALAPGINSPSFRNSWAANPPVEATARCKDGTWSMRKARSGTCSGHGGVATFLGRVPFCLPGEKRVCTLGPPPVCHCEPLGTVGVGTAAKTQRR